MRVTGDAEDAFAFRTPSLRNVTLTAPYGHDGAYPDLETVIQHHLDPLIALENYSVELAVLPELEGAEDFVVASDPEERDLIAEANELEPITLSKSDIDALIAFLATLTDPAERLGVPETVPSGLPVDR